MWPKKPSRRNSVLLYTVGVNSGEALQHAATAAPRVTRSRWMLDWSKGHLE